MKDFKRYTVTAALPYANGPLHIGHLAGVYIPADIYVRYLRMKKRDVVFICGSDEHGVPITIKARETGVSPKDIVDKYHKLIKESFEEFGVSFDIYSRTSNKIHHETSSAIFKKLFDNGKLIEQNSEQFYDVEAKQFLADRYITGTCPHCNHDRAFGDQCEACGTSLSPKELVNPASALSGATPILKKTKHWYLPLNEYEPWLKKWILEGHKSDWRSNVYGQCKSWITQGLQPRAVTRDLDWGVKVPIEGADGKVLYVWFDAPIGYISATRELTEDWEKYWKDPESRLIHFIGKDNIVFHCIIFPAILHAEGSYILPDNVPSNEFLNLEGDKISTSGNWAVWLHEYLKDFPGKQDVLRYVLAANAPETKDNDFTWKDFQARNNNELLAIFGNLINRTVVLTHKFFDGVVPDVGELINADKAVLAEIKRYPSVISESIENFRFRDGLNHLMNFARLGNKYLTEQEPWKKIKEDENRVKTVINVSLQICANLALLAEPFLPATAEKIKQMLNIKASEWDETGNVNMLQSAVNINKPEFLFEKIDDEAVKCQVEKLKRAKIDKNSSKDNKLAEPKETISFEEFLKMDIRTGTITAAEVVPKTKKLLKITVKTGIDQRTVVSGIAEFFKPEDIIGKKVSLLINLAARKLRGIESKGMILMAEDPDGKLFFVSPEGDNIVDGSVIK